MEEKRKALNMVTLIKEKRNGDIKGRACADGSKQRYSMNEETNVSSPTVSTEALFTTLIIDAHEKRHVATFDVQGAFLQPELQSSTDDTILLKMKGIFVDIMCDVNPEYKKPIIYENGTKTLYMEAL